MPLEPSLFPKNRIAGEPSHDRLAQDPLDADVGLGHGGGIGLLADVEVGPEVLHRDRVGAVGEFDREGQLLVEHRARVPAQARLTVSSAIPATTTPAATNRRRTSTSPSTRAPRATAITMLSSRAGATKLTGANVNATSTST